MSGGTDISLKLCRPDLLAQWILVQGQIAHSVVAIGPATNMHRCLGRGQFDVHVLVVGYHNNQK